MTQLSAIQTVVLSKLEKAMPEGVTVPAGVHRFDFVVRVSGEATKAPDGEKKPTSRALTLETLALFIQRSGIQREKALEILVEVMRDNIILGDDQKVALMEVTGVKAAKERLDEEMEKLPKTKTAGAFKIKEISVEAFGAQVVGDTFVPHVEKPKKAAKAKQADPVIPEISGE